MFKQIKGGELKDVQGLACWVPPVGYVYNVFTKKLEKREIIKRSDQPAHQYWEREPIPEWYEKRIKYVQKMRKDDPTFFDPRCKEYEDIHWDRRLNGCWFMNKGKAVYLTGLHWMFIQWWKIDIGYPKFRFPDLEYFYFLQYCLEDPLCLGMIEVTKRRFGKTFRAGLFAYEYTSRTEEAQSGIQSKTNTDAKKFFSKAVIKPFKALPAFFRPEYDMAQGITPKTELRFQQTNVRGKKAAEVLDKEELGSMIDFMSSEETAYDGQKLHRKVDDEIGKTIEVNVYDRHEVNRYCLLDDEGRVIGKALYTTTVEKLKTEKDGISDAFKSLWDDSDHVSGIKENGMTASGLYRFFMPAYKTRFIDKYGVPDEEKAKEAILKDRASVAHNPRSLSQRIRKEPMTIQEAFRSDGDKCMFNGINLNDQRDMLQWNEDFLERGNYEWENGIRDSRVLWRPTPTGRWSRLRGFNPGKDEVNQVERRGNTFWPTQNYRFGSAADPYDHEQTQNDSKRSMAASVVKQKNNLHNHADPFINAYISLYHGRPNSTDKFYEDMIMQCFYYGCSILVENNKPGIVKYFRNRKYEAFLVHLPGYKEPGIPATPENKQTGCELIEYQVEHKADKIYFIPIIDDLLKFDVNKTKEFDISMAVLWCEVACANPAFNQHRDDNEIEIDIYELFNHHKVA